LPDTPGPSSDKRDFASKIDHVSSSIRDL
jgi:hypothetical protein